MAYDADDGPSDTDDKPTKGKRSDDDVVADAKEAFELASDHEDRNRKDFVDDVRFARLEEQWPDKVRKDRELDGRPCLTINRMPSFIRQVVNDGRQNKPAITVHPADDDADPETAEIFNGLIRNIEQSSDSEIAYDTALDNACSGGFGYFKIDLDYADDETFDQDICIRAIANPLTIYGDPNSVAFDSSDWDTAHELDAMSEKAFKARWKGAECSSFTDQPGVSRDRPGEIVTVASWWTRETVKKEIVLLSEQDMTGDVTAAHVGAAALLQSGPIIDAEVYKANKAVFDAAGHTVIARRKIDGKKVTQRIVSGAEELEKVDWVGKYIPIVPVYGEVVNIEGVRHLRSLIRAGKDPQRMFNYWRTMATEVVALAPKAPWVGKKGAFVTDAAKWATANTVNHQYIEYDGNDAPERQPFAGVPAGAIQEALNAADDMKATIGLFDASLGAKSNETSGKAIMARQREGDVNSFHFVDNLARGIRHGGRIIIDLIPKVYSVPRVVRILGPDGKASLVPVNQKFNAPAPQQPGQPAQGPTSSTPPGVQEQGDPTQVQQIEKIYDLRVGKYDLTVSSGPSFTSRREEAATQMMALIQAFPPAAPVIGDLLAKNLDWPGADEIADRLHAMLPPQAAGQDQPNPQVEQAKHVIGQLHEALQKGETTVQDLQQKLKAAADKHDFDMQRLVIDRYNAETNRLKVEAPQGVTAADLAPIIHQAIAQIAGGSLGGGQGQSAPMPANDPGAALPPPGGPALDPSAQMPPQLPPAAADAAPVQPSLPPAAADAIGPDDGEQPPAAKP